MANIDVQVQGLAGTATNALQWVNDGVRAVTDRVVILDPDSAHMFSQSVSSVANKIDISDRRHVLSVEKGSKSATEIPATKRFAALDANSLQKASDDYPQYYILNQAIYVAPTGAFAANIVDYANVTNISTSTIANFPDSLIPLVVNYAAMKSLNERMVGFTGLSGLLLSLPSIPPQPILVFSVTDTLTDIDTNDLTNISLPEFVAVADPNIGEIDLSPFNAPVLPSQPQFSYEDAQLQKIFGDLSVSFSTNAPTYTPPNFSPIDFAKITSLIQDDEDIELAQSKLSEEQTKVSEFSAKVQDSLNVFNKENAEYQIQYQKSVQEFESKVNKRIQEMSISTNTDVQNKAKKLEKQVSEYSSKLQRFTQDLQRFQADINKSVQEWTLNNLQYKLSKWQTDTQSNLNEYQARVGSILQKYSADISKMGSITQTEVNKLGGNLQKEAAKNSNEIQMHNAKLQSFAQESSVKINEFNSKMQKAQLEYQWLEKQYALVREQYEKGFEPFIIRRQQDGEQSRLRG